MESGMTENSSAIIEPLHRKRIKHSIENAEKYLRRKTKKHQAEMALLKRGFSLLTRQPATVLDAPCGVGRATIFLAGNGYQTTGIDLGEGAVRLARQQIKKSGVSATIDKGDLLDLPYNNRQFDALLCFRLLHHLPTVEFRGQIIAELCRVSADYVLISYLSPKSYTSIKRSLRYQLTGKKSVQNTTSLTEIKKLFAAQGFNFVRDIPQLQFFHSLHLAIFSRNGKELIPPHYK
jgi:2-polyprenyl-3-methyl-5-hydroxy-6-metoxy-1,4-benzoquinol methylase